MNTGQEMHKQATYRADCILIHIMQIELLTGSFVFTVVDFFPDYTQSNGLLNDIIVVRHLCHKRFQTMSISGLYNSSV